MKPEPPIQELRKIISRYLEAPQNPEKAYNAGCIELPVPQVVKVVSRIYKKNKEDKYAIACVSRITYLLLSHCADYLQQTLHICAKKETGCGARTYALQELSRITGETVYDLGRIIHGANVYFQLAEGAGMGRLLELRGDCLSR